MKREKKIAGNVCLLARAENYLPQPTTEPSVGTRRDTHPSTPTRFSAQTHSQWGPANQPTAGGVETEEKWH